MVREIKVRVEINAGMKDVTLERSSRFSELRNVISRDMATPFRLTDGERNLDPDMKLSDYSGRIVSLPVESRPEPAADERIVTVPSCVPGEIGAAVKRYTFIWGDKRAGLPIADGQRVSAAKVVVAEHWHSMGELVTLLHL
jgi:hypothetical protein